MSKITLPYLENVCAKSARPLTREAFFQLVDSCHLEDRVMAISRETDKERIRQMKSQLPAAIYGCLMPQDGVRPVSSSAVPSGFCIVDWDHIGQQARAFYEEHVRGHEAEQGIVLSHVTPSGRGLRLVARLRGGESIPQCQERLTSGFGAQDYADTAVKDVTRLSYLVPRAYILYIDEESLFESEMPATVQSPSGGMGECQLEATAGSTGVEKSLAEMSLYEGIRYSQIIEALLQRIATNGSPTEGERNADLYALVYQLRHITGYQFEQTYMLVKPYFSTLPDREIRRTVNSALGAKGNTMTPFLRGVIAELKAEDMEELEAETEETAMPRMPTLPPLLAMLCRHFPRHTRPLVALSALPILGVYGTHIRFRYLDNRVNSLSFMVAVMGRSGSGKSFASHLNDILSHRLQQQDTEEREKAYRYQQAMNLYQKGGGSAPQDPKAKVRLFADDITTSVLLEYLKNLDGEHGYQFTEELAAVVKARKSRFGNNDDIYLKGFDNAVAGKESMSSQTHNIRIPIYLNTLFCGTYKSMRDFFNNPEGGLPKRFIFCEMPAARQKGIPSYEDITPEERQMLDATLDQLWQAGQGEGEFRLPFLERAIRAWIDRCDEEDEENPNEEWRDLASRSAVMGMRAGMLAYFLWERRDDKRTRRLICQFAIWVAETARAAAYRFCGSEYERINRQDSAKPKAVPSKNKQLLSLLPDHFTRQELRTLRLQNGDSPNERMVICRWRSAGLISQSADGTFHKVKQVA